MRLAISLSLLSSLYLLPWLSASAITAESYKAYQDAETLERDGKLAEAEKSIRRAIAYDPEDPFNLIKLAGILVSEGKAAEAIGIYKRSLILNPLDTMLNFSVGSLYEQTGDYYNALAYYEKALKANPAYRFGLLNTARTLTHLHESERALADYQAFLLSYPEHYEGRRYFGKLLLASGHPKEAAQQFGFIKDHFPDRFADHLDLARALNGSQNHEEALSELEVALNKATSKADVYEEMAHTHEALHQVPMAARAFDQALAADPKRTSLWLDKANLYADQSQWADAEQAYLGYLATKPDDMAVQYQLATVYLKQQAYPKAIPVLKQVMDSPIAAGQPATVTQQAAARDLAYAYQMSGQLPAAIPIYESLLNQTQVPEETLQIKKNLAIAYHQAHEYDKALPLYRELALKTPTPDMEKDLVHVLLALGDETSKAGDNTQAMAYYQEANAHADSQNLKPLLAQADLLSAQQQWDQAETIYQQILQKEPNQPEAKLFESRQALRKNQPQQALTMLTELQSSDLSRTPEYSVLMGDVENQLGNTDLALEAYEKAVGLKGDQPRWWVAVGETAQKQQNHQRALQAYQQAVRLSNPDDATLAPVFYNMGVSHYQLGQLDAAEEDFTRALHLNPNLADARYALGSAFEAQKKYPEAIREYEHFRQEQPSGTPLLQEVKTRLEALRRQVAPASKTGKPASTGSSIKPPQPGAKPVPHVTN